MSKYLKVIHIKGLDSTTLKLFKDNPHVILEEHEAAGVVGIAWPVWHPIPEGIQRVCKLFKMQPVFPLDSSMGDKWEVLLDNSLLA